MNKAPDFSRYPNVSTEKTIEEKTLFKVDAFDQAWTEKNKEINSNIWISLYMKVGLYCGWSWKQFYEETPYSVIQAINSKIDEKIENLDNQETFFNYQTLSVALGIAKCFGKKS